jgi:prophage maintenance system killer protein
MSINEKENQIVIYQTNDGVARLEVKLEEGTVWLSQKQMAELFDKGIPTINEHIKNVYKEGELDENSTIRKYRIVQKEGNREVLRETTAYNLDVIISVGYRVKSLRGTQFRIWATNVLKQHIVEGFSLNEERLKAKIENIEKLSQALDIVQRTIESYALTSDEYIGIIKVVTDYNYALKLLDQYDHQKLKIDSISKKEKFRLTYENAIQEIQKMKEKNPSVLFGNEKDKSFESAVNAIYQSFDGKDLYPSLEEKAANLLYMTVKNHAFSDGNKRIAAAMFLWFLAENGLIYNSSGQKRIADNTIVAVTLMIAESKPAEKDTMVKLVVNLINQNN